MDQASGAAFNATLKRLLRERGYTYRAFAEHLAATTALSVSHAAVQNWATDDLPSKPWQVFAIEHALDLGPGTLSRLLGYLPLDAAPALRPEDALRADPDLPDDFTSDIVELIKRARRRARLSRQ